MNHQKALTRCYIMVEAAGIDLFSFLMHGAYEIQLLFTNLLIAYSELRKYF